MEWNDHRLEFYNLKMKRSGNTLGQNDTENIWMPYLVFKNTDNSDATIEDPLSFKAVVAVTRDGNNFTPSPMYMVEEINIFDGSSSKITFTEVHTKMFKCEYQLQFYPFDTQVCICNMVA